MIFDFLLFDNFSNHCLANTVEPLRAANMLSGKQLYAWRFLTLDGTPATSSSGMQVTPQDALANTQGDLLAIMPSYGFRAIDGPEITTQLRRAARHYRKLAGLDTGSWLLARAGLLEGYTATIHWEELSSFAEEFPDIEVKRERFVLDGDRITCSGAMAAFDLTMHLISEAHGTMLAIEVAQLFMTRDSARSHASDQRVGSKSVNRAISLMQENLEHPLPIAAVARHVGCSQKTLETRMKAELDAGPQAVYQRLRLNLARKLVAETDQSVSEIAGRCGYENASAMTRAFKREFSITPRDLRNKG
ncbi:MAG: GlxA family transcriptional regulator [Rhodobacteraceae bacterium]|jgi:transcriptional regulator GlxA family with amidase domain|nr:GlxA family transcriptional regulator [Paracoccaceae bacterium]